MLANLARRKFSLNFTKPKFHVGVHPTSPRLQFVSKSEIKEQSPYAKYLIDQKCLTLFQSQQPVVKVLLEGEVGQSMKLAAGAVKALKSKQLNVEIPESVQQEAKIILELANRTFSWNMKQKRPISVSQFYFSRQISDLQHLESLASAKRLARSIGNLRANVATPEYFVKLLAELQLEGNPEVAVKVLGKKQLQEEGMGLFYGVGMGSINEPRLINLTYKGAANSENMVALVGKGLTFDTGGYNIKPGPSMAGMFMDKEGACVCLSAFKHLVEQRAKVNVTCTLGMAENMISGKAYRPDDILTSKKGLTVEIGNTDAEGRLVLADCLTWTQAQHKVSQVIDIATLTGGCVVALGNETFGLHTNDDEMGKNIVSTGTRFGEDFHRLPVSAQHRRSIKGKFADINNTSNKKYSSMQHGAAFLQHFIEKGVKWTHLDIAGSVESESQGVGSQTLMQYVIDQFR